ncbi:hypothetical protein K402DRAFT_69480 [Aulographum hederae CBS 113979]|uniref:Uncharacterized protein n=1 Tax=Aulographum hederae CBS 113979 TaxID=1176131 RepID=A0A6G1HFS0_9PEZI|nr:hypothetical protein K402DRAFT_69480 [Aulographum hederae CBS 113979]
MMETMKSMQQDSFSARPLPPDPTILTYETVPTLQDNAELWANTCSICRPIVRDLKIFCSPQEDTFEKQNVYIQWHVIFSRIASVISSVEKQDTCPVISTEKYKVVLCPGIFAARSRSIWRRFWRHRYSVGGFWGDNCQAPRILRDHIGSAITQ